MINYVHGFPADGPMNVRGLTLRYLFVCISSVREAVAIRHCRSFVSDEFIEPQTIASVVGCGRTSRPRLRVDVSANHIYSRSSIEKDDWNAFLLHGNCIDTT